jgi:hypothetical protein
MQKLLKPAKSLDFEMSGTNKFAVAPQCRASSPQTTSSVSKSGKAEKEYPA